MLTMTFLMLCIAGVSSQASTEGMPHGTLSFDWTSFSITHYQGFPTSFASTDLSTFVNKDGDQVNVHYNSLHDSRANWNDWSGIMALTGNQALAETTPDILYSTASLENGGLASAETNRHGRVNIAAPGLVHISVIYNWSMWASNLYDDGQMTNLYLGLSASSLDYNQDWTSWKHFSMGQWGNTTDSDGSGTLELFFMPNDPGEYRFSFDAQVYVSAPLTSVPVPSSALLLFSGLISLMITQRVSWLSWIEYRIL